MSANRSRLPRKVGTVPSPLRITCKQCGGEPAYRGAVFCGGACSQEYETDAARLAREQATTLPRVAVGVDGHAADLFDRLVAASDAGDTIANGRHDAIVILKEALADAVAEGLATATLCDHCGAPGKCFGAYEGEEPGYACDDCCGHGNEDGRCIRLEVSDDE